MDLHKLQALLQSNHDSAAARLRLLDPFTLAYVECLLWAETDQSNEHDANIGDIAPDTLRALAVDCQQFQQDNGADLAEYNHPRYSANELGGHDFYLTRNRHGAGFWSRDCLPHDARERLTVAAHKAGERSAYVGDDSLVYCQ